MNEKIGEWRITEDEWRNCTQPNQMMRHLRRAVGQEIELRSWFAHPDYGTLSRKWRCFLAACCQRVAPCLSPHAVRLIEFARNYVDAEPTEEDRQRVLHWFGHGRCSKQTVRLLWGLTSPLGAATGELRNIAGNRAWKTTAPKVEKTAAQRAALDAEAAAQCTLIRDIFGNPFSPFRFNLTWRTPTTQTLAQSMYDRGDFTDMPIFGDTLEEAGCDNDDMLQHCHDKSSHVRGCWVVDLLLKKE